MHWRRRTPCLRRVWRTARSAWVALLPYLYGVPLIRSIGTASFLTEALSLGSSMLSRCCNVVVRFFFAVVLKKGIYTLTKHAPIVWPEFSRKSLRRKVGTMRPGGRSTGPAPPCARSRTTALTRSPPCSVRSRSGCRAFGVPTVAGRRLGPAGRRTAMHARVEGSGGRLFEGRLLDLWSKR
jgi:hypothetical protein